MNERIADLLEQAFDRCKKYDDEGQTGLVKTTEAFHVFAELIVKECIRTLERHHPFTKDPEAYLYAISLIEEHFGVE